MNQFTDCTFYKAQTSFIEERVNLFEALTNDDLQFIDGEPEQHLFRDVDGKIERYRESVYEIDPEKASLFLQRSLELQKQQILERLKNERRKNSLMDPGLWLAIKLIEEL